MITDLDDCSCDACQSEEVIVDTQGGIIRLHDFLVKLAGGSYFDHPDCRIAVDEYEEIAG